MKIIQILLTGQAGGSPFALVGLDDDGHVWYGNFEYGGKETDPGPASIVWRLIGAKKL